MTPPQAWLATALATAFATACALVGALWMKLRADAVLREATRGRAQLLELAQHWVWETDAAHRLSLWRPPAHRAEAWRAVPSQGELLTALARALPRLDAAPDLGTRGRPDQNEADALERQMQAHAPLMGVRVKLNMGGAARPWLLHAQPRHDGDGRFIGYVGSALPVDETETAEFAQAALSQVLASLDDAVLLFRESEDDAGWKLSAYAPPAQALLGLGNAACDCHALEPSPALLDNPAGPGHGLGWAEVCSRLPTAVAQALSESAPGEQRDVGEWRVGWSPVGAAGTPTAGRLVLLRQRSPVPVAIAEPLTNPALAASDAADQESFIYSVSHDLRAPIRVVEGFARILKEDYGRFLDRIGNDHTDRILAAAARMNSMIDALLALSRLQSQPLKRQPVDLSQLAHYILEDLRREHPERGVDVAIEPGLVAQGDPTLMRIAMENLIGNAWKYSAQAALTRIELRREFAAGKTTYVVADNGAGFDMRFADRLFGVFQRLHSAKDFQGTGVGLASVRRIIRRHGGDIWAQSEVGKGARFYFTLP